MDWLKQTRLARLGALLLSSVAPLTHAQAQSFAKVGAVNPEAMGTPPGGASRVLTIGSSIVVKERVRTTDAGSTQLLFPDQSTLNLGANSDMVIDEYYYNPDAKTGSMVASATKGVLRYVGGQISHSSGVTITTPSAVLGIRGGIATLMLSLSERLAELDPHLDCQHGNELVINHFGSTAIKNNVSQVTLRPGYAAVICSANQPIGVPFKASDALLRQIMRTQTSRAGQNGGFGGRSGNGPAPPSFSPPPGFGTANLPSPARPPAADPLGYTSVFSAGGGVARNKFQTNQVQSVVPQAQSAAAKSQAAKTPSPPPSYP